MILFKPILPWSAIALTAAVLTVVLFLFKGLWDYFRKGFAWSGLGGSPGTRRAVVILTVISALFFAAGAMNPVWVDDPSGTGYHLQVAVDVSESVLRADGGWTRIREYVRDYISRSIDALPSNLRDRCSAGILTFRDNTFNAWEENSLEQLPEALMQVDENSFAAGKGTNIETGLRRAGILVGKTGSPGAVLLVSDGNQTAGNALDAAAELARRGIPVHVFPVTSRSPAIAITDANLPRQAHAEVKTFVRALLLNRFTSGRNAELALIKDTTVSESGEFGVPLALDEPRMAAAAKRFALPSGQWVRVRWPVVFEGFGLQFVDLELTPENSRQPPHRRRFFTYVKRPPRILAIGGDNRWMEGISADTAKIIPVPADIQVNEELLKNIDAVVINSVPAVDMTDESQEILVRNVKERGLGLLFVNGPHEASDESDTVIMSYKKEPLDRILPVGGGPWPEDDQPPGRQVVIMIDTSGSMGARMRNSKGMVSRIEKSREIAQFIIADLLGPRDRLDLITFTTGAAHLVKDKLMDGFGKTEALEKLHSIRPGGGTDPGRALLLLKNRKMFNCGLIVISDGEFRYLRFRPDCRATVFEIDNDKESRSLALQKLADPIPVGAFFNPASIMIPYFEESKIRFFKRGDYQPLTMNDILPPHQRIFIPEIDLEGTAVTHLREGAILNAVRPKFTHPVLVFSEKYLGSVGVFTTSIPYRWASNSQGKKALKTWLSRIIPMMDRNRYDFKLEDLGNTISMRIALVSKSGNIPEVSRLSAVINFPGKDVNAVAMRADDYSPGTFYGEIRVPRGDKPRRGVMTIREFGPDALPRDQKIPIMIPPRTAITQAPTSEAHTFGQNSALLQQLAQIGGGKYNAKYGTPFFKQNPIADKGQPLWPWMILAALLCYLTAIALKRWNP